MSHLLSRSQSETPVSQQRTDGEIFATTMFIVLAVALVCEIVAWRCASASLCSDISRQLEAFGDAKGAELVRTVNCPSVEHK